MEDFKDPAKVRNESILKDLVSDLRTDSPPQAPNQRKSTNHRNRNNKTRTTDQKSTQNEIKS